MIDDKIPFCCQLHQKNSSWGQKNLAGFWKCSGSITVAWHYHPKIGFLKVCIIDGPNNPLLYLCACVCMCVWGGVHVCRGSIPHIVWCLATSQVSVYPLDADSSCHVCDNQQQTRSKAPTNAKDSWAFKMKYMVSSVCSWMYISR